MSAEIKGGGACAPAKSAYVDDCHDKGQDDRPPLGHHEITNSLGHMHKITDKISLNEMETTIYTQNVLETADRTYIYRCCEVLRKYSFLGGGATPPPPRN